jgi:GT2 family glycosyltransferase
MAASMSPPQFGVVILTMGKRPAELRKAIESVIKQSNVDSDIVVVGNGWEPVDLPMGVRALALAENVGIPAGRNAGVELVSGDTLFFLDDDAELPDSNFLERMAALLKARPEIGLIQPRVVDPTGKVAPGRWVPRLRVGDPSASGPATSLWEGATVIRRSVFDTCGGWPEEFFYAHEGIDLVWRVWDAGFIPWYAGDIDVYHPVINPLRHDEFYRMNARNRVWLARRNLPVVLEPLYVGSWAGLTMLRVRDSAARKAWFAGMREGMSVRPSGRKTMKWKTVWAMTKAGRPPVI